MTTLKKRRYDRGSSDSPWLISYTITITSDRKISLSAGDFMTYSLADEAARELVDMLECRNERGLVVTIAQAT